MPVEYIHNLSNIPKIKKYARKQSHHEKNGIPKDAPRIDAGVGASLSDGEGADVDGDVGVGEGET